MSRVGLQTFGHLTTGTSLACVDDRVSPDGTAPPTTSRLGLPDAPPSQLLAASVYTGASVEVRNHYCNERDGCTLTDYLRLLTSHLAPLRPGAQPDVTTGGVCGR